MAALYDPRTCAEEPSVPFDTNLSLKQKVFIRGSFSTGTTGYGVISFNPIAIMANDLSPMTYTVATSTGGSGTILNSFTALSNGSNSNSLFATSAFTASPNGLLWKLTGAALYVKYADTELNRGGDMVLIEQPNHQTLGLVSYVSALNNDFVKRVSMGTDWVRVCYTPNGPNETSYSSGSPGSSAFFKDFLGVFVNSAGSARSFDFEAFAWFEVVGQAARGASISMDDPIGYHAVLGAANQFQQLDSVLGADGFLHAVEDQLANVSGVGRNTTHQQNWAGLAAFLPQIAGVATRALSSAGKSILTDLTAGSRSRPVAPPASIPRPPTVKQVIKKKKAKGGK